MVSKRPDPSLSIIKLLAWAMVPYCTFCIIRCWFRQENQFELLLLSLIAAPAITLALALYALETWLGLVLLPTLAVAAALFGFLTCGLQIYSVLLFLLVACVTLDAARYLYFNRLSRLARNSRKRICRADALTRMGSAMRVEPAHLRQAIENVGSGPLLGWSLAIIASLVMLNYLSRDSANKTCGAMVVTAIIVSILSSSAKGFFKPKDSIQGARDHVAEKLGQAVLLSGNRTQLQYTVYLRPFDVTGRLLNKKGGSRWYFLPVFPQYYARRIVELEVPLGDATWSLGIPLLGLGRPGEAFGAGRLASTEATWRQDIAGLIAGARIIFIIPSDHPGTLWELGHIMEHRANERCVFVMPWMVGDRYNAERWQSTRAACRQIGLELPEYNSRGALLCQDRAGGWLIQPRLKRLVRRTRWLKLAVMDLQDKVVHSEADANLDSVFPSLIPESTPVESDSVPLLATDDPVLIMTVKSLFAEAGIPYHLRNEGIQNLFGPGHFGSSLNLTASPVEIFVDSYWRSAAEVILAELQSATVDPVSEVDDEDGE